MSRNASPPRLPETDYATIETAVMETARGRWFLTEYARRNRAADTESVLKAIARLEEMAGLLDSPTPAGSAMEPILKAIDELRGAPWQGVADADGRPLHERPAQAWRSANIALRSTAEKIREVAFELRETGKFDIYADALELYCTDLIGAASLQETASNRLIDVASLLAEIEALVAEPTRPDNAGDAPPKVAEGERAAEQPSIAPSDPPRFNDQATKAAGDAPRSTPANQSTPTAAGSDPVLMFVRPD